MLNVEFIFDKDCPNVKATRKNLMKAFSQKNMNAQWKEWDRNSEEAPHYARKHGSPTILINGIDIMGVAPESNANCCRVYEGDGVPSIDLISSKLSEVSNFPTKSSKNLFGFLGTASIGPSVGAALLAKATCPLCYPAIAGFLSSIGLGFLFKGTYFYIFMSVFLGVALFGLGYKAKLRRGFMPFFLGLIGSTLALIFHYMKNDYIFYFGIGILVIASIWNLIPVKKQCNVCN
jgi:mercuric ion transport protein